MAEINFHDPRTKMSSGRVSNRRPIRTPQSCDRCKSRKTKCVNPNPGPCDYCAATGDPCVVNIPRKQRPFYHVTEEEYRASMKILHHHYPDQDLTMDSLRSIIGDIERGTSSSKDESHTVRSLVEKPDEPEEQVKEEGDHEQLTLLHNDLGSLMQDQDGKYRLVCKYSELTFNDAVCCTTPMSTLEGSKIIAPDRRHKCNPEATYSKATKHNPYLPPREYCNYYVALFFEQIHCTYWFFPSDQFYSRLDETYKSNASTPSWLCCLYSIFALSSVSSGGRLWDELITKKAQQTPDTKSSADYLDFAMKLVLEVGEESDMDSIRGLAILALALQTFGNLMAAWLHLSLCIQISYSFGIPYDHPSSSLTPVEREQTRWLWWTLYLLDHSFASFSGNPFMIDDVKIQEPSDVLIDLSPGNPPSHFRLHTSLCRLRREIINTVYPKPSCDTRTISFTEISVFLSSLQAWLCSIPTNLAFPPPASIKPSHRRAISLLYLDYYSSIILLTRPFLLYITRHSFSLPSTKRKWIHQLAEKCTQAAQDALVILKVMAAEDLFSSITVRDSTSVLGIIIVLILSFWRTDQRKYCDDIEDCVALLRGMEQIGWCKMVLDDLPIHLDELGVTSKKKLIDFSGEEEEKNLELVGIGGVESEVPLPPPQFDFAAYFFDAFDDSFYGNMELDVDFFSETNTSLMTMPPGVPVSDLSGPSGNP